MARILIVDDSPTQTLSLAKILKKNGHDVMTAKDGAEGVEVAKAELPDLVPVSYTHLDVYKRQCRGCAA